MRTESKDFINHVLNLPEYIKPYIKPYNSKKFASNYPKLGLRCDTCENTWEGTIYMVARDGCPRCDRDNGKFKEDEIATLKERKETERAEAEKEKKEMKKPAHISYSDILKTTEIDIDGSMEKERQINEYNRSIKNQEKYLRELGTKTKQIGPLKINLKKIDVKKIEAERNIIKLNKIIMNLVDIKEEELNTLCVNSWIASKIVRGYLDTIEEEKNAPLFPPIAYVTYADILKVAAYVDLKGPFRKREWAKYLGIPIAKVDANTNLIKLNKIIMSLVNIEEDKLTTLLVDVSTAKQIIRDYTFIDSIVPLESSGKWGNVKWDIDDLTRFQGSFSKLTIAYLYLYNIDNKYLGFGISRDIEQRNITHQKTFMDYDRNGVLIHIYSSDGRTIQKLESKIKDSFNRINLHIEGFRTEAMCINNLEEVKKLINKKEKITEIINFNT